MADRPLSSSIHSTRSARRPRSLERGRESAESRKATPEDMTEAGRDDVSLLKLRERLQCAQQAVEEEALLVLRERLRCAQQAVSEQRASMLASAEHALQAFSREASFCRDLTTQLEGSLALAGALPQSPAGEAAVRSLQREVGEVARLVAECAVWQPAVSTVLARIRKALAAEPGAAAVRTRRLYRGGGGEATALAALAATAMQAAWRGWRARQQSDRMASELAEGAAAAVERGDAAAERRARALALRAALCRTRAVPSAIPSVVPSAIPSAVPSAALCRTRDASASVRALLGAIDVPWLTERLVAVQRRVSLGLMALSVHMGAARAAAAAAAAVFAADAAAASGTSAVPSAVPSAIPSAVPSAIPSAVPSAIPSAVPSAVPSAATAEALLDHARREAAEATHAAATVATAATAATMPSARAVTAGRGQKASTELSAWLSAGGASSPPPLSPGARADLSSPGARAHRERAVAGARDDASLHEPSSSSSSPSRQSEAIRGHGAPSSSSSPPSPPVAAALAAAVEGYRQRRAAIESAVASADEPEEPRDRDFLIRQWAEENRENSEMPSSLGNSATSALLGKAAKAAEPERSPLPDKAPSNVSSPLPNKEASSPRTPVFRVSLVEESLVDPLFAAEQAEFDRLVYEELAALRREGGSK
jgi:hypothetical protein